MQRDGFIVVATRVIALSVGELALPAIEVDLSEAFQIPPPFRIAKAIGVAPDRSRQVGPGLRDYEFALLTGLGRSPGGGTTGGVAFRDDSDLGVDPG